MSTNTTNMAMGKAVDGDNAKTYLETTLGAALDKIDAHDHSGTTHGLATLTSTTLASPTLTGTTTGVILTLSGLLTANGGITANGAVTVVGALLTGQAGLRVSGGDLNLGAAGSNLGFFAATNVLKQTVTGSRGSNVALASLITALANYGLVTDSSS